MTKSISKSTYYRIVKKLKENYELESTDSNSFVVVLPKEDQEKIEKKYMFFDSVETLPYGEVECIFNSNANQERVYK
jgi:hypothetical protein